MDKRHFQIVQVWFRIVLRPVLHSDSSRPEVIHDNWELELEQREGRSREWRMIDFRIHYQGKMLGTCTHGGNESLSEEGIIHSRDCSQKTLNEIGWSCRLCKELSSFYESR